MTELEILFSIDKITGESITLNQAIEVKDRVINITEVLEKEGCRLDMDELIRETIDEVLLDKPPY